MHERKRENQRLAQLEKLFDEPECVAKSNNRKKIIFFLTGVTFIIAGMYFSKLGVMRELCDILICWAGIFLAYSFCYRAMNKTNFLLTKYTKLDRDLLRDRLSSLSK